MTFSVSQRLITKIMFRFKVDHGKVNCNNNTQGVLFKRAL